MFLPLHLHAEKREMKRIIQDFSGVERAAVEYQTWSAATTTAAAAAAGGLGATLVPSDKGVCSDNGTTVTVTFERVSLEVRNEAYHCCSSFRKRWVSE